MSIREQIECGLRYAYMCFDADEDDFRGCGGGEVSRYGGDPHAEAGFVNVFDCGREVEFCAGFAETRAVLCGGVDGDGEEGGG